MFPFPIPSHIEHKINDNGTCMVTLYGNFRAFLCNIFDSDHINTLFLNEGLTFQNIAVYMLKIEYTYI